MTSLTLEFEEANSEAEADISIMWAEGEHGDSHKFDGAGENGENVLAHTFFPSNIFLCLYSLFYYRLQASKQRQLKWRHSL
jgi:hypothetical protein